MMDNTQILAKLQLVDQALDEYFALISNNFKASEDDWLPTQQAFIDIWNILIPPEGEDNESTE